MASFNGQKYIKQQIDSILPQLSDKDEIVISDDGSDDDTLNILYAFNDPRIIILHDGVKRGINGNFENALSHAKGDIIFLSDQDDVWLPLKVDTCVAALRISDIVVSNCIVTDDNLNIKCGSYFISANSGPGFIKNFYKSSYLGCCLAFKKEILPIVLPIPNSLLLFHDWWFGFISEIFLKVHFIETPCMYYRRHDLTASKTSSKSNLPIYLKIYFRLQLLYLGLKRALYIYLNKNKYVL